MRISIRCLHWEDVAIFLEGAWFPETRQDLQIAETSIQESFQQAEAHLAKEQLHQEPRLTSHPYLHQVYPLRPGSTTGRGQGTHHKGPMDPTSHLRIENLTPLSGGYNSGYRKGTDAREVQDLLSKQAVQTRPKVFTAPCLRYQRREEVGDL